MPYEVRLLLWGLLWWLGLALSLAFLVVMFLALLS